MSRSYPCPDCHAAIPLDDVNVASDIALCRACGTTTPFSRIADLPVDPDFNESKPPKGVRVEESTIHGKVIRYRRVPPMLFFLIPFTLAWSGFSMGGIYGTQIAEGKFNPFMSLFGLPFLIGTIVLVSMILFGLFGTWKFAVSGNTLFVTMAIGPAGWTRRLVCDKDTRVSIVTSNWRSNNQRQEQIEVSSQAGKLRFGGGIPEIPIRHIAESLRRMIRDGSLW